jgi:hypothetical protein
MECSNCREASASASTLPSCRSDSETVRFDLRINICFELGLSDSVVPGSGSGSDFGGAQSISFATPMHFSMRVVSIST